MRLQTTGAEKDTMARAMGPAFAFAIGDVVWHKATNSKGIVINFIQVPLGPYYVVAWGPLATNGHYECELSAEPCPDWDTSGQ